MTKILTHDFGKSFPSSMTFSAYVFMVIGLIAFMSNIILGSIFIIIGAFVGFTRSGIQINTENKNYRSYNSFLGIKQGKWQEFNGFSFVTLLKSKEQSATLSASNRRAITSSDTYFDICLLNENHRKKLAIKRLKEKEQALIDLKYLSELLGYSIAKYNPQISIKSQKKRARK